MNILILAALNRELIPIQNQLTSVFGKHSDVSLDFKKIPVGRQRDHRHIRSILTKKKVDVVINVGTAGAISVDLQVRDVFFPSAFVDEQNQTVLSKVPELIFGFIPEHWKTGTLFTSNKPVLSAKRKDEIVKDYRAGAVDMEAYSLASVCAANSVPFISLKVISDTADSNTMTIFRRNLESAVEKLSEQLEVLINILLKMTEF